MKVVLTVIGVIVASLAGFETASYAGSDCVTVGWESADAECAWTYADYTSTSSSGVGHTWVVSIQCGNGGICADQVECNENGETGFVHDVYMDGTDVGDVCVPDSEVDEVNIAQLIIREFKRLDWPASTLVVEPPGGKTLVNLETNFYTDDKSVISKDVTVARQAVTIEAAPATYTFYFGDGTSTSTSSPGQRYPGLDVSHSYSRKGEVAVSLDTTYSGRYKIGDGDWVAIPETLTVAGATQDLAIVEALPQLVLQ